MCIDTFRRTAFFIFMLASSLHAIEEQSYEVIEKLEGFEVRRYHDHIVVETEVNGSFENSGNQGFRRLASYIFGNNEEQTNPMKSGLAANCRRRADCCARCDRTARAVLQRRY